MVLERESSLMKLKPYTGAQLVAAQCRLLLTISLNQRMTVNEAKKYIKVFRIMRLGSRVSNLVRIVTY